MKRAFLLLSLLASTALADDRRAIDMTVSLQSGRNEVIRDNISPRPAEAQKLDPTCEKCPPLTLGRAVAYALRVSTVTDPDLAGAQGKPAAPNAAVEKALRDRLANSIEDNKAATLTNHDLDVIKKALNLTPMSGVVMLAVLPVIDPNGWQAAVEEDRKK